MKLEDYRATSVSKALGQVRDQLGIAALTEVASFVDGPEEDPYAVYVATDAGLFVFMVAPMVGDLTLWRNVAGFRLGVVGRTRLSVFADTPAIGIQADVEDVDQRDSALAAFAHECLALMMDVKELPVAAAPLTEVASTRR